MQDEGVLDIFAELMILFISLVGSEVRIELNGASLH